MPLYSYRCATCEGEVDVLRTFENYTDPPTPEDPGIPAPHADGSEHTFERVVHAPRTIRGPSWNGSKGNW